MRRHLGLSLRVGVPLALLAGVPLAACSPAQDQPGAIAADEAQQLNDAAEMLDANSVDLSGANESQP